MTHHRSGPVSQQRTIAQWRESLAGVRLPALSAPSAVAQLLSPDASLQDVLSVVCADPPLALEVLSLAAREPRLRDNLRSLQHAVNMLGLSRVQARVRQVRPADAWTEALRASRQALATSRLAALIADDWALQRGAGDRDHLYWSTLLMGVARWKLPWVDTGASELIEQRLARGERRIRAETDVLGCAVDALNALHLQDIGLGEASDLRQVYVLSPEQLAHAARLAWTGAFAPEIPPALAHNLHRPTTGCALAYGLALEVENGWYGQRLYQLLAVASAHLGQPVARVRQGLIRQALAASQHATFFEGLAAPAQRLLWPAAPATRPPSAPPATPRPAPSFLQRCTSASFTRLQDLVEGAQHGLRDELGLQRHALFLRQGGAHQMACQLAAGFTLDRPARQIGFSLELDDLLSRVMHHPSGMLWVRPQQVQAVRLKLPPALATWPGAHGVLIGSVRVQGQPAGFWWAAPADPHRCIDEALLGGFRHLVRAFESEFTRLMRQQRRLQQPSTAGPRTD